MLLGFISRKYESGDLGPGVIADNASDPGGKSYGSYQLSFTSGTLNEYLNESIFKENFKNIIPTSRDFDNEWIILARHYPKEFLEDQHRFIVKHKYQPVLNLATKLGYNVNDRAMQEALFSIAVQHGNYYLILVPAKERYTTEEQLKALYYYRAEYVDQLNISDALKASLLRRYKAELTDLIALQESEPL